MFLFHGPHQSCGAAQRFLCIDVGAAFEQEKECVEIAIPGCEHERRLTIYSALVHQRACVQQSFNHCSAPMQ